MSGYSSTVAYGSATHPAAAATIATMTGLQHGLYSVVVSAGIEGTGTATDNDNMVLNVGATLVGTVLASFGGVGRFANAPVQVAVPASGSLTVACGAGTSGVSAVYSAQIVATPLALFP